MTRDELIALAKTCGAEEFYNEPNKLAVNGQVLEAFSAALSCATPAGGGLTELIAKWRRHAKNMRIDGLMDCADELEATLAASPVPTPKNGLNAKEISNLARLSGKRLAHWELDDLIAFVRRIESASPVPLADTGAQPESAVTDSVSAIEAAVDAIEAKINEPREPGWSYRNTITTNRNVVREECQKIRAALAPATTHSAPVVAKALPMSATGAQEVPSIDGLAGAAQRLAGAIRSGDPELSRTDVATVLSERSDLLEALVEMREAWVEQFGERACDCRHEPENSGHMCQCCKSLAAIAKATGSTS